MRVKGEASVQVSRFEDWRSSAALQAEAGILATRWATSHAGHVGHTLKDRVLPVWVYTNRRWW
jgi:hypothetical protein